MTVLSIDTATEVLGLSAMKDDAWATLAVSHGLQHGPSPLPLAERLLAEVGATAADLGLVVCSLGPGSFTGIRIGLATALGIAHARGIPVVGASTLDALAAPWAAWDGDVYPVLDARKGRYYTALYRGGRRVGEYMDTPAADLAARVEAAHRPLLAGHDAPRIRGLLGDAARAARAEDLVDGRALLRLGLARYTTEGAPVTVLEPLYLRKSEAELASGG